MNPNEFAETIKAKYPQYKDVDNLTLATKMVEKYPTYASKVNFNQQVTPESVIEKLSSKYKIVSGTLESLSTGAVKGALGTVTGAGTLVSKALSNLPGKTGEFFQGGVKEGKRLQEGLLKAEGTAEQIGKGIEQIAEFFIPASKINAVEKILAGKTSLQTISKLTPIIGVKAANIISRAASLGTKMAIRATEGGGIIALQTGGEKRATLVGAGVGTAFPPAGALAKPILKYGGEFLAGFGKRLAGMAASGRGTSVIDEIVKDPKSALEGLSGKSLDVLTKDAKALKEAAVNMKIEAGKEYNRVLNNLQTIYENEGKSFDKGTEINKITDLLQDKFGITKAGKVAELTGEAVEDAGALDFNVTRFQKPNEQNTIKNALKFVKSFREPLDPKRMEGIASTIDKMKGSDSELNSVLQTITSSLRESVAKMGEEAGYVEGAELARNFAVAMDKLEDFTKKFKATAEDLRPKGTGTEEVVKIGETRKGIPVILPETEKTAIIQDLSTLFSGNKDADKETLRKLVFGGQEVLSREAGRTLATASERASGKLADFIREAINTVISPTLIGKIVARTTLSANKVTKILQALKKLDPAKRAAVIKLISENNQ